MIYRFLAELMAMILNIVMSVIIITIFLYPSWNYGFVPAFNLRVLDFIQVCWLSVGISVIGTVFRSNKP